MSITASFSLTLEEWLEAGHVHGNPIQIRKKRASWVLMAWLLVPMLPFVATFVLNFTPYSLPPQVLDRIVPSFLTASLIGAVLLLSGPSLRKLTPWLAILLIVGGLGIAIYSAFTDHRTIASRPAPTDAVSMVVDGVWPLMPWVMMLLGMTLATRRLLERVARREWESSPALRNPMTVIITDTGLTLEQADQTHQFQWTAFLKVRESKDLFVLYTSENRIHILPKRAFNPKDLSALGELLKSKVVPADAISTAFGVIPTPQANSPVHVQPLEPREFI